MTAEEMRRRPLITITDGSRQNTVRISVEGGESVEVRNAPAAVADQITRINSKSE